MSTSEGQTLGEYIRERLEGRSLRALATYAGISIGTASNLINDRIDEPAPSTLLKVADYLDVPVQVLYRLVGYLPEDADVDSLPVIEATRLMRQLPSDNQSEILEIVRALHRFWVQQED